MNKLNAWNLESNTAAAFVCTVEGSFCKPAQRRHDCRRDMNVSSLPLSHKTWNPRYVEALHRGNNNPIRKLKPLLGNRQHHLAVRAAASVQRVKEGKESENAV